jgi:hypothetical protein
MTRLYWPIPFSDNEGQEFDLRCGIVDLGCRGIGEVRRTRIEIPKPFILLVLKLSFLSLAICSSVIRKILQVLKRICALFSTRNYSLIRNP